MLQDFKTFIMRGNVMDMAVGIIIGAAFTQIVNSFVDDVLMPPIGLISGGTDFSNLFVSLTGEHFETLAQAQAAGAPLLKYGLFLNAIIQFLIVSFAIFLLIRFVNRLSAPKTEEVAPDTKHCPYCCSQIPLQASRCPHCTSELQAAA